MEEQALASGEALIFNTTELHGREDARAPDSCSPAYRQWFKSFVQTHLAGFPWPNDEIHRLVVASRPTGLKPVAFLYYYVNEQADHCELFGLFVEDQERHAGVATAMLLDAIDECARAGCRSFALRFLEESARDSRLVASIKSEVPSRYPRVRVDFFFPEDPRNERIGA